MADSLLVQKPSLAPPLDPDFRPAALGHRAFAQAVASAGGGVQLTLAIERAAGEVAHFATALLPEGHPRAADNLVYVERLVKFLLWQKGGFRVHVAGPRVVADYLAEQYAPGGARAFDADFMAKVYEAPRFVVSHASPSTLPRANERPRAIGGHWNGCRIGFDAGGSDRKVAAVIDGKEVFSCEVPWQPKSASLAQYHVDGINDSIRLAAAHLPRIDAIGVSSAGIYVNNRTSVASLFLQVSAADFEAKIRNIYLDVAKKWGNVPLEVANDGDVSALAGALSLGEKPVLGVALGTSQAVGYVDRDGLITGWLNELAFAPVDYSPTAPVDVEWSGDRGTGVHYFSQDAVIRLAARAGIVLPQASPGERLEHVQELMKNGDERPRAIYESIGVYLGYGLLQYSEFYDLAHVLLLGRVTSGSGGELVAARARDVLRELAPDLARRVRIHLPDEASRRVGQAIAAASLPKA
jgi:predicted NBD/HSP70 family sugar kinase